MKEKFGVAPEQVVDVLALMGDSIDNIKGVPGIGEKGARDLIAEYGDLENLLAHAGDVKNKRQREGLLNHADDARQSRTLARIHVDCPVEFDAESMRYRGSSRERCFELFTRLGFRTLVMDFAPTAQTVGKDYAGGRHDRGRGGAGRRAARGGTLRAARAARHAVGDAGVDRRAVVLDGAAPGALRAVHDRQSARCGRLERRLRFRQRAGGGRRPRRARRCSTSLRPVLEDPAIKKIGHDLKFDAIVLERHGVLMRGLETDTMIASYLVDANRSSHPLEELALEHTGYKALTEEDVCGRGAKAVSFAQIPVQAALDYARRAIGSGAAAGAGAARDHGSRDGSTPVYEELEHPLHPGADGDRARRGPHRRDGAGLAGAADRRGALRPGAAHLRAVGRGVQHQLAEEAGRDPLRQDGPDDGDAEADVEDQGALDRVRGAGGARAGARAAAARARVARA